MYSSVCTIGDFFFLFMTERPKLIMLVLIYKINVSFDDLVVLVIFQVLLIRYTKLLEHMSA